MEITKDTKIGDILATYGDIAEVMEAFGVKRIGRYSFRRLLTKLITVEQAARIHRMPVDQLLTAVRAAVALKSKPVAS